MPSLKADSQRGNLIKTTNIWPLATRLMLARTVINLPRRFPYAFIPEISRQLSVSLDAVQGVVATQAGVGLIAPLFVPLSDFFGRKITLMIALAVMFAGSLLGALFPEYIVFAIIMIAMGIAKVIFDPSMHAYIGEHVHYSKRGAAIGFVEVSWSLSLVIAAPLTGFIIGSYGLRGIYFCIALLAGLSLLMLGRGLPADRPNRDDRDTTRAKKKGQWSLLVKSPAALGSLAFAFLLTGANEMLFIVYGSWMELSFALKLTTLGLVTIVIALAEVTGEFAVIGLADRIGKQRMAVGSAFLAALGYLSLPLLATNLTIALVILFVLFIGVECAIVSTFPLFTEVLPEARSLMMSSVWSAHSLGRLAGASIGSIIYAATDSFAAAMIVATIFTLTSGIVLWRFVPDTTQDALSKPVA